MHWGKTKRVGDLNVNTVGLQAYMWVLHGIMRNETLRDNDSENRRVGQLLLDVKLIKWNTSWRSLKVALRQCCSCCSLPINPGSGQGPDFQKMSKTLSKSGRICIAKFYLPQQNAGQVSVPVDQRTCILWEGDLPLLSAIYRSVRQVSARLWLVGSLNERANSASQRNSIHVNILPNRRGSRSYRACARAHGSRCLTHVPFSYYISSLVLSKI